MRNLSVTSRVLRAAFAIGAGIAFAIGIAVSTYATAMHAPAGLTFIVDSTDDLPDATPGDGICQASLMPTPACTLRAAIMEANAYPGADTIIFSSSIVTPAVFLLTRTSVTPDDDAQFGDLDITGTLTIVGSSPDATIIDALGLVTRERVIDVRPGASVTISALTIRNGKATGDCLPVPVDCGGAGIRNQGALLLSNSTLASNDADKTYTPGGGIYNLGVLTAVNSALIGNPAFWGGGLANDGSATLNSSLVASNSARYAGSATWNGGQLVISNSLLAGNFGGTDYAAVANTGRLVLVDSSLVNNARNGIASAGIATVTNSTIANNDGNGIGCALVCSIFVSPTLVLENSTVVGNSGTGIRGWGVLTVTNSIVAQNAGGDCGENVTPFGHNLSSDASCPFTSTGDISATNPLLNPLDHYGGPYVGAGLGTPMPTMLPLPGSPVINRGDNTGCPVTDQRGVKRPQGFVCDIGAVEVQFDYQVILPQIRR